MKKLVSKVCNSDNHKKNLTRSSCFFFFLNQQFITWHTKADCGSYFHNYIHRTQTTLETKKEKRKEKK